MKLTYRGIEYSEAKSNCLTLNSEKIEDKIVYRGNSPKARIKPDFPWLKYIKQLFKSGSKPTLDPITFWYDHKREFIEDCWQLDDADKSDLVLNITTKIARDKQLKSRSKIKLKYRGVTYYK